MIELNQVDFKLYGLVHEKSGAVRADVFASKLSKFINGLKASDKYINGKRTLNYLITNLEYGSAVARISEERISTEFAPEKSSISYYQDRLVDILDGKKINEDTPKTILKSMAELADGNTKKFSHGEISFVSESHNIIRIDDFFNKRADNAFQRLSDQDNKHKTFSGTALIEYRGIIKEVDLRGQIASAKLILSAGSSEIDCICNSVTIDNLREALNQRVVVSAKAYFNGMEKLPERLDIKKLRILKQNPDLTRWEKAFDIGTNVLDRAI